MEQFMQIRPEGASSLGMALVLSSVTPLLLLDDRLVVQAASETFCSQFGLASGTVIGTRLCDLGNGEWGAPQLRTLLEATASGHAGIEGYEFILKRPELADRVLVLNAHVLDEQDDLQIRLALAISDITGLREAEQSARDAARDYDALFSEKQVLLQELNHRVANSLQIIASILMQRVRQVQSEESRTHLREAHHRVMSIATLQRMLAATTSSEVSLRIYLTDLCASIAASMIADPDKLVLRVTADDSVMNPEQSVSLGLIVTELVINSLKHAYPGQIRSGLIEVKFATTKPGWVLSVADDGAGMPRDIELAKPGLGTGIVQALAGQLGAEVVVVSHGPGTTVTLTHRAAPQPSD
jgi:two-component sensor histidine kinase